MHRYNTIKFIYITLFFFINSFSYPENNFTQPLKKNSCLKIALILAGSSVLAAGTTGFLYQQHHDLIAPFTNNTHIGYGIYYNHQEILDSFTPEEKTIIKNAKNDFPAAAKLLIYKMKGGYEEDKAGYKGLSDYHLGKSALDFFSPNNPKKGVCEHKAKVLFHFGKAENWNLQFKKQQIKSESNNEDNLHAFIIIDFKNKKYVLDPEWEIFTTLENYSKFFLNNTSPQNNE